MDLRSKPGKVQGVMEYLLRFRLISVVVLVLVTLPLLISNWQEVMTLPAGASESFGMWFANVEGISEMLGSARFLGVAAISTVVLCFVFTGVKGGISSMFSFVLAVGTLFVLGGDDSMVPVFFGTFALLSLVLLLFAKWSVACGLFPFVLSWLFLSCFVAWCPIKMDNSQLLWAVFSGLSFCFSLVASVMVGKFLSEGDPKNGAMVKVGKKLVLPVVISSLLAIGALAFDMGSSKMAGMVYFLAFVLWFYLFLFPIQSFAPWEKLRSKERRVKISEKKSDKKKK
ncbi:MAG: hypothetical protein HUK21_02895 [Fibrobacteraceae bacterium]|nr:hypothetical protein [Fibrobacteraceae bacterium]